MPRILQSKLFRITVFLLLFIVVFFSARIPYYVTPLRGEDGIFAKLVLSHVPGPDYLLLGRVNGIDIFCAPEHPAFMYGIIGGMGTIFRTVCSNWTDFSDVTLITLLRFSFSLFQLALFIALIWIAMVRHDWKFSIESIGNWVLITVASMTPLAIGPSIALQVDGSSGILMTGFISLVVMREYQSSMSRKMFLPLLGAASFFIGLGKNEWSIIFLAAVLVCFGYCLVRRFTGGGLSLKQHGSDLLTLFFGNLFGNLASYLFDPINYRGGFNVISRIMASSGYAHTIGLKRHLDLLNQRWPFLFVVFLLILLILCNVSSRNREKEFWVVFVVALGCGVAASFSLSSWAVDVRYFAPALVPLLAASIMLRPFAGRMWQIVAVVVVIGGLGIPSATMIKKQFSDYDKAIEYIEAVYPSVPTNLPCVPRLPTALCYRSNVEFISNALDVEGARAMTGKYGRYVCQ